MTPEDAMLRDVAQAAVEWAAAHAAMAQGSPSGPPDDQLLERYSEACTALGRFAVDALIALDAERARYAALREAARAMADAWVDYVEAQAGRGHIGQTHNSESVLEGGCGICAAAQYGTEVAITEHVLPALRAALEDDR